MIYDTDDDDDEEIPTLVEVLNIPAEEDRIQGSSASALPKVPITIVTGYLGSGKSTLLNHILTEQHNKKIAVILNEFGDSADIEKSLTVNSKDGLVEEWLELANGCICCSIKDNGVLALESLMRKRGSFDYILLETTGLADPGNIAPLFWLDNALEPAIYLDGIVTLVDAGNIFRCLDERYIPPGSEKNAPTTESANMTVAHLQISHADVIVINKCDLITSQELDVIKERIRSINPLAKIHCTTRGVIRPLDGLLLSIKAYDESSVDRQLKINTFTDISRERSQVDSSISTLAIKLPGFIDKEQTDLLNTWLGRILWEKKVPLPFQGQEEAEVEIHRLKGRVIQREDEGRDKVMIIQGVREVFEFVELSDSPIHPDEEEGDFDSQQGKLIFIGRRLLREDIEESLRWFVVDRNGGESRNDIGK